jgi:dTDP-4-amino-4,6-dideoxygalactose transaminase
VATANSIRYCGAVPVFVDICPDTFNIDPDLVEAAITTSTHAILCVHQMGMPCDLTRLVSIAKKHGLPLIEDAACAIGSEVFWEERWEGIGKPHGDVACFSFHPRKIISTGDGGMITTKHQRWDEKFRLWRQHGMSISDSARHAATRVVFEEYTELGFNYRMTDIQAAIGREQLKRLPEILVRRRELALEYRKALEQVPSVQLPCEPDWARSNWQSFCIRVPAEEERTQMMQSLLERGIATRRGIACAHREPAYKAQPWRSVGSLYQSERAQDTGIILPLYPHMAAEEQLAVLTELKRALAAECVC